MKYKGFLHPDRINSLPVLRDTNGNIRIVKHKPQENSSCVTAFGGKALARGGKVVDIPLQSSIEYVETSKNIKKDVNIRVYSREYDNPDKPDVTFDSDGNLQWTNSGYCNQPLVASYVRAYNHKSDSNHWAVSLMSKNYALSLIHANLCYKCKKPIKTQTAKVAFKEALDVTRNTFVAVIKSHFEIAISATTGKLSYWYIDGTGRKITFKAGKLGDEYYCDGIRVYPNRTYTVYRQRCDCGLVNIDKPERERTRVSNRRKTACKRCKSDASILVCLRCGFEKPVKKLD